VTNKKGVWDNGTVPRWPIPCLSATVMSCEWGGSNINWQSAFGNKV
jgi:hypothetical protein